MNALTNRAYTIIMAVFAACILASCGGEPAAGNASNTAAGDSAAGETVPAETIQAETLYELRIYQAPEGRLDELLARFRAEEMQIFANNGAQNVAYFTPIDPADERLIYLLAFDNEAARGQFWQDFLADPDWKSLQARSEADGPLVTGIRSQLMHMTDYSPDLSEASADGERIFELRTYTASEGRLEDLHARFRDHTVGLFDKAGMTNIAYFRPIDGQDGADDTLTYLLSFPDEAARGEAWGAFLNDPDWQTVQAASNEPGPVLVQGGIESILMVPTDFSPLQ